MVKTLNIKLFFITFLLLAFVVLVPSSISEDLIDKDLYKVLGLKQDCTFKEIKKAYRKLAQIHRKCNCMLISRELVPPFNIPLYNIYRPRQTHKK